MSALSGIRAWLPPVYGPKRRYEAPTCVRDRSKVWADTITVFQARHMLATMIDPKHILSGWMPRRVHVTDDDGNVVREMTAEQLGVKMVARGAVEFAVDGRALPSKMCPGCGGRKVRAAHACASCTGNTLKPQNRVCPLCGGEKTYQGTTCEPCYRKGLRSQLDVGAVTAAYLGGASARSLSSTHNVSPTTIRKALRSVGVKLRPSGGAGGYRMSE